MRIIYVLLLVNCFLLQSISGKPSDAIKERDIPTLKLFHGQWTTSRRASPIPQLQCDSRSVGCKAFIPSVVTCKNKGWNGFRVIWECDADNMDNNALMFGEIDVRCERYAYPNDPYVLKGSCGLRYTIHLKNKDPNLGSKVAMLALGIFVCILPTITLAIICCSCETSNKPAQSQLGVHQSSSTNYNFRGNNPSGIPNSPLGYAFPMAPPTVSSTIPPPPPYSPGFRHKFVYGDGSSVPPSFGNEGQSRFGTCYHENANNNGVNSFWSGAATGGLAGYLIANQNNDSNNTYCNHGTSNTQCGGTTPRSGFSNGASSGSSGTRTASGFGGTSRR